MEAGPLELGHAQVDDGLAEMLLHLDQPIVAVIPPSGRAQELDLPALVSVVNKLGAS